MATANDENGQGDPPAEQEREAPPAAAQPVLFDGQMPGALCSVAQSLREVSMEDQRTHAAELYEFLSDPDKNLLELNGDGAPRVGIINVTTTAKVKVV